MGIIKDRNDMELTEAEEIKKRWQEYTEELKKKKGLNDSDNHFTFLLFFFWGWYCLLPPVQYYEPLSIAFQAHSLLVLIP